MLWASESVILEVLPNQQPTLEIPNQQQQGTHQRPAPPHGALEPIPASPQAAPAAAVGGSGHRLAGVEPDSGSAGQGLWRGGAVEPVPWRGNGEVFPHLPFVKVAIVVGTAFLFGGTGVGVVGLVSGLGRVCSV